MGDWASIAGVVRRAGAPADGAYVTVRDPAGNFTGERRTDAGGEGRFRFHLSPGSWVLEAVAPRTDAVRRKIDLGPGEEALVEIDLA
jgi:hypothetical protein